MHLYIEAVQQWDGAGPDEDEYEDWPAIFFAGGITGCPDWQAEIRAMMDNCIILNPRRADFPMGDPSAADAQIKWEFEHLRLADQILFWFPAVNAADCPITLYELGAWSMTNKRIAVGVEPGYRREADVRIQTALVRPEVSVVSTLADLAEAIL